MRLGIFGGSFDPVHYGHLLLAESCREQCQLDAIWFVPAAIPPHKLTRELTAASQRAEMLQLAIAGDPRLHVSTIEIDRCGVSYTIETLTRIHDQHPRDDLFLLMGADSLQDLGSWREPRRICQLAIPVAVRRSGCPEPDFSGLAGMVDHARLDVIRRHQVQMPLVDISSSELRRRVAAGQSIRFLTPRAVETYIETQRLYQR